MKKYLLLFGMILSILMPSCSGNNECVEQISAIINKAAAEGAGASVTDVPVFTRPGGNVFANEEVKTIIKENMNYKLSEKDKEMLKAAVNNLLPDNSALEVEQVGSAGKILIEMRRDERKLNMTKINDAKTLGDLL